MDYLRAWFSLIGRDELTAIFALVTVLWLADKAILSHNKWIARGGKLPWWK